MRFCESVKVRERREPRIIRRNHPLLVKSICEAEHIDAAKKLRSELNEFDYQKLTPGQRGGRRGNCAC